MTHMPPLTHEIAVPPGVAALLPAEPTHDQMTAFAGLVLAAESTHGMLDIGTQHHHADGIYGRSITLQADAFLVGLPHTRSGIAVCVGDITVWTAGRRERFTGAHILRTQPGTMRIGYAHADTTWLTVHSNDTGSTDTEVIENALVVNAHLLMTRRAAQGVLQ